MDQSYSLNISPSHDIRCPYVNEEIKENLNFLKDKIKKIEKHIYNLIQTTQSFKQIEDILMTVPGIDNRSITGLLCYLPELRSLNRK
jgi:transposase